MAVNKELIDYIKLSRVSGKSNDSIKAELLKSGWSEIDVNSALADNSVPQSIAPLIPESFVPQINTLQKQEESPLVTASPKFRWFIGSFGFIFVAIGIYFFVTVLLFSMIAVQTVGTITGNTVTTSHSNGHTEKSYCPQATFTADGKEYNFTNNVCSSSAYSVGSEVDILYDPNNPSKARIKGGNQWVIPVVFTGVGLLAFLGALFNIIKVGKPIFSTRKL